MVKVRHELSQITHHASRGLIYIYMQITRSSALSVHQWTNGSVSPTDGPTSAKDFQPTRQEPKCQSILYACLAWWLSYSLKTLPSFHSFNPFNPTGMKQCSGGYCHHKMSSSQVLSVLKITPNDGMVPCVSLVINLTCDVDRQTTILILLSD